MRTTIVAFLVALGLAVSASAQSSLRVVVTDGDGALRAEMRAATMPYATGEPRVTITARALKTSVDPTVAEFRVRSWNEGEGVRVLVFAVIPSDVGREVREEEIASVFVPVDGFVEIAATEKYNARRITITAFREPLLRRPYRPYVVETLKIAAHDR